MLIRKAKAIGRLMAALFLLLLFLHLLLPISGEIQQRNAAADTFSVFDPAWLPSQTNRALLSPNSLFSAGFLHFPSNSSLFLFSVWVLPSTAKTPVWSIGPAAASSTLFISHAGSLTLAGLSSPNLFPSSASGPPGSSSLRLNDDGSLTFYNWTSFSSPTNTLLPNQRLRKATALSSGDYRFDGSSLLFNSAIYWPVFPISYLTADGAIIGDPNSSTVNYAIATDYGRNHTLRRLTLDVDGNLRLYSLLQNSGEWKVVWEAVLELCRIPNTCGPNSICVPDKSFGAAKCVCLPGFRNYAISGRCVRKMDFLPDSKFLPLDYVSFTGKQGTVNHSPMESAQCRSSCLENPSCSGFSYILNGWQNCFHHYGELDRGYWSPSSESTFFLRVASSETDSSNFTGMRDLIDTACPTALSLPVPPKEGKATARNTIIFTALLASELLFGGLCFLAFLRRYSKYRDMARTFSLELLPGGSPKRFSYAELREATAGFSNILGSGSYGVVYRGQLPDGRAIAVKQLRKRSGGGGDGEFWAEVTIVARMHHLNLVLIWGFCAEKQQRLLVYEYIPNGSLDKFLFSTGTSGGGDGSKSYSARPMLDLSIRYRIALGVARAIAYLHEECLEWVLHCDIKPENILLDDSFCPRVSDFGLSKLTGKKERVSMSRIRGTRGYMAPEWVMSGEPITAKADVYSFGVVLLELVAGIRCWDFRRDSVDSVDWYFPRWAYDKVYVERKVEDLVDLRIWRCCHESGNAEVVERMVKTAMWCLQDRAEARPSMGKAAKMLEGSVVVAAAPAKPTIFYQQAEGSASATSLSAPLSSSSSLVS